MPDLIAQTCDVNSKPVVNKNLSIYKVLNNYKAQQSGELNLKKGNLVFLVSKLSTNWWKVKLIKNGKEGLAMANNLEGLILCLKFLYLSKFIA